MYSSYDTRKAGLPGHIAPQCKATSRMDRMTLTYYPYIGFRQQLRPKQHHTQSCQVRGLSKLLLCCSAILHARLQGSSAERGAERHLQRGVNALAKGSGHSVRRIPQQHHARGGQARHLQGAPAGVPRPLRELLRNVPPHLLQPSSEACVEG